MLEIPSFVLQHLTNKLNSHSSTSETTHLKQLPIKTFVSHTNLKPVKFTNKLKPLHIGLCKVPYQLYVVAYELMARDDFTFYTRLIHILPYYPNDSLVFHTSDNVIQQHLLSTTLILNLIGILYPSLSIEFICYN